MPASQRVVVVTGGSSGIGKQVALDLLRRGDTVIIVGHDSSRLRHAEAELREVSPRVEACLCDVRFDDEVRRVVEDVLEDYGRIDVLINNAGYAVYRTFEESEPAEVLDLFDVNLLGAVRFMKACLPAMVAQGHGRIVNVASIAGRIVITPNAAYMASKHALVALSEGLAYELAHQGIGVTVVCPGRVETPFFDHETFRNRLPRRETRLTVSLAAVSRAIVNAIDQPGKVVYVPRYLGLVAWVYRSLGWFLKPVYGALMRSRIRSLDQVRKAKEQERVCP